MGRPAVAVWQMAPVIGSPAANLARLREAASTAAARGAGLLVTPELALTGYDIGALTDDLTDPALLEDTARIAGEIGLGLVVGLAVREHAGVVWNAAVAVDSTGTIRATYRKIHLFGGLDSSRFAPGPTVPTVVELDGVRVGMLICYDIEFPEAARSLALAGADLIAVPTANMAPWTAVNEHIIPARAVENQVYVAYANHIGRERDTHYVGRSVIAGPDGTARRAGETAEEILVTAIDLDDLTRRRAASPYLADRRPHLYHALTTGFADDPGSHGAVPDDPDPDGPVPEEDS